MNDLAKAEQHYRKITYEERACFYAVEHATEMDAEFLMSFLTPDVGSILEVPCGVGRNVFLFATRVKNVMGVDLEENMIEFAKQRCGDFSKVPNSCRIDFAQGDMRTLSLDRTFDLVVVPIDAFQLLHNDADAIKSLKSLSRCLSGRGSLLIDLARFGDATLSSASRPIFYDPGQADGDIVREWTRPLPCGSSLTRSRRQLHDGRFVNFRFYYDLVSAQKASHMYTDLILRSYTQDQIEALIAAAGLKVLASFGDHHRSPITEKCARFIFQLRSA